MIKVVCSKCGTELETPERNAGGKGECPECGMIVKIPDETGEE